MFGIKMAALAVAVGLTVSGTAAAQTSGQEKAYDYALKCWAVAGHIATQPDGSGNLPSPATIQATAAKSYNAAYRMGGLLGYSNDRIARDLDATGSAEGAALLQNRAYFERSRSECTQLGLL